MLDRDGLTRYIITSYLSINQDDGKRKYETVMVNHLKMSALYWALTSLVLLRHDIEPMRERVFSFLASCYNSDNGGYAGDVGLGSHLLFTLSALQILHLYGERGNAKTTAYILSLQHASGSFAGDEWGEVDSRFVYCAVAALHLLQGIDRDVVERALCYLKRCVSPMDGSFGAVPGAESHGGQVFCAVAAFELARRHGIHSGYFDHTEQLLEWLAMRQQSSDGGFSGRPQKATDVCYSWWILSAVAILQPSFKCIDATALRQFILASQDQSDAGACIADRPGDVGDLYHTFFGLAGLALLGEAGLREVDPALCLPFPQD